MNLPRPSNSMLRVTSDVWLVTCPAPNKDARSAELADGKGWQALELAGQTAHRGPDTSHIIKHLL